MEHIYYNQKCGPKYGNRHVRWIENVSHGLRLAGFADEICRSILHTGWFTDDDGTGEVARGVVYYLPHGRFAYGVADPCNEDCALLSFDLDADDKEEAARYADRMAERYAEQEREYRAKWNAAQLCRDMRESMQGARKDHSALIAEMRRARTVGPSSPLICAELRARLATYRQTFRKARRLYAETLRNFGDEIPGPDYA